MYYSMFAISFFLGMVLFILSFFVQNKHEQTIMTGMSCVTFLVIAVAAFDITYITANDTLITISDYYIIPSLCVLMGVIQVLRLIAVPYDNGGENDG